MTDKTPTTNPSAAIAALRICDRLQSIAGQIRVMALACNALDNEEEDAGKVANMLFDIAAEVHDIGDEVHENGKG